MISEDLKELLIKRSKTSELNFKTLINFLSHSKYRFIGAKLRESLGLATTNTAYLDLKYLDDEDDKNIFFTILHEYAHLLKISKMGKDKMVENFSTDDLDLFVNHIIEEEIFADRFARFYFYHLNNELYPTYRTQRLEKPLVKEEFKSRITPLFGKIKDEKDYNELIRYNIVDWRDIDIEQPSWYEDVELLVDGKIIHNFHRVQGDDKVYYGSMNESKIIFEEDVSHWRVVTKKEERQII